MTQPNFGSILDKPSEGGKRPPPLPAGTYLCVVKGLPRYDKSTKKFTEFVEFTLQPLEPQDDVDKEALEEMGGLGNRTIRATFYLTDDAIWRLEKFLNDCGVADEDHESRKAMVEATPGQQVFANLRHKPYDDGSGFFAELAGTTAVE